MSPNKTTSAEILALKDLMYDEASDSKYYADLSRRRCAYEDAASLRKISDEEALHLKKLQAEYFIITGSTYFPCVAMLDTPTNYLDALRERFIAENESAAKYLGTAASVSNPRLSMIYTDISEAELRQADTLARLISENLGKI